MQISKTTPLSHVVTFKNSQKEDVRGTLMKITRNSILMEVYNPYSIVQLSEMLDELTVSRGNRVVYKGKAVVNNLVNTGLMLIVSVELTDAWKDLTGLTDNKVGIREEVERFVEDFTETHQLLPEFQIIVVKMRSFLDSFNRWLEQADVTYQDEYSIAHNPYREFFANVAGPVLSSLNKMFDQFEVESSKVHPDFLSAHKQFAQSNLHPLMLRSPFVHRVYSKPLGYAGDYEMIEMIQRDPIEGPNTYARLINTLYINAPIPRSVANRTDMLITYYRQLAKCAQRAQHRFSAISIGCGPTIEVRKFINDLLSEGMHVRCIDFNEITLKYAREQTEQSLKEANRTANIEFIHESVHQLLKQALKSHDKPKYENLDFVYCSGLFDYLSDKVCGRLLRLFYTWIRPGGIVLATNMHTNNPSRYAMEYFLEWHLIYRDEDEMEKLAPNLGVQRLFKDETGVNITIEITKPN